MLNHSLNSLITHYFYTCPLLDTLIYYTASGIFIRPQRYIGSINLNISFSILKLCSLYQNQLLIQSVSKMKELPLNYISFLILLTHQYHPLKSTKSTRSYNSWSCEALTIERMNMTVLNVVYEYLCHGPQH